MGWKNKYFMKNKNKIGSWSAEWIEIEIKFQGSIDNKFSMEDREGEKIESLGCFSNRYIKLRILYLYWSISSSTTYYQSYYALLTKRNVKTSSALGVMSTWTWCSHVRPHVRERDAEIRVLLFQCFSFSFPSVLFPSEGSLAQYHLNSPFSNFQ